MSEIVFKLEIDGVLKLMSRNHVLLKENRDLQSAKIGQYLMIDTNPIQKAKIVEIGLECDFDDDPDLNCFQSTLPSNPSTPRLNSSSNLFTGTRRVTSLFNSPDYSSDYEPFAEATSPTTRQFESSLGLSNFENDCTINQTTPRRKRTAENLSCASKKICKLFFENFNFEKKFRYFK